MYECLIICLKNRTPSENPDYEKVFLFYKYYKILTGLYFPLQHRLLIDQFAEDCNIQVKKVTYSILSETCISDNTLSIIRNNAYFLQKLYKSCYFIQHETIQIQFYNEKNVENLDYTYRSFYNKHVFRI